MVCKSTKGAYYEITQTHPQTDERKEEDAT
jgi:hypothetical protein